MENGCLCGHANTGIRVNSLCEGRLEISFSLKHATCPKRFRSRGKLLFRRVYLIELLNGDGGLVVVHDSQCGLKGCSDSNLGDWVHHHPKQVR